MVRTLPRRRGVTLIELLIVMGLLGILAAIAATAAFRAVGSAKASATEVVVARIDSLLKQKWDAVVEEAKKDVRNRSIDPQIVTFCNNDEEVAAVVWVYTKLKMEFPTTYAEAVTPGTLGTYQIPTRGTFANFGTGTPKTLTLNNGNTDGAAYQSAACLYTILSTPTAGGTNSTLEGLENQIKPLNTIGDPDVPASSGTVGSDVRVLVDGWGKPISFVRLGFSDELQIAPYATPGAVRDPFDPRALLNTTAFPSLSAFWTTMVGGHFPTAGPPTKLPLAYPTSPIQNWSPAVVSAGGTTLKSNITSIFGANPLGTADGEADNIVSYRVRAGKKGF